MIASVSSSVSALKALNTKMGVTSHNVANVNTDEFEASRVTLSEDAANGVKAVVSAPDGAGNNKGTDLSEEFTGMISTQAAYDANLKTIQTRDEMTGTLLDEIG